MTKMIQLRNVPDDIHRTLKARAALARMSLSDYLLAEIVEMARRPSVDELRQRLSARRAVETGISPAAAVREERSTR